jgi:hypothetical protein
MKQEDKFKALASKAITEHERNYALEAEKQYGSAEAYKQSHKKYSKYSTEEKLAIVSRGDKIFREIAELMDLQPTAPEIQKLIAKWQQHISDNFYDCSNEILAGLGEMYVSDKRFKANINKTKAGLAEYFSAAIKIFVQGKNS